MSDFALRVDGVDYRGWKGLRVQRSIEQLVGSFSFEFHERWAKQQRARAINGGADCAVLFGDQPVITGYVEELRAELGGSTTVSGKDRTCDVVDSSALLDKWEWTDTEVLKLAQTICRPFGVSVSMQAGLAPPTLPRKFSVNPGDSAGEALEKLCRTAALLPISDGRGNVVLTRSGSAICGTALKEGRNVKSGSIVKSMRDRFHEYRVLGSNKGSDNVHHAAAASVRGNAFDANVRRSRTKLIRPEAAVNAAQAKARSEWEASVRFARSLSVSLTASGWTQDDGKVWPLNALVYVELPSRDFKGEMLITGLTSVLDGAGSHTEFELRLPASFKPEPTIRVQTGAGGWAELRGGV